MLFVDAEFNKHTKRGKNEEEEEEEEEAREH